MERTDSSTNETSRIKSFSDGIFGFSITLLVLELIGILHPESDKALLNSFLDQWRSFLAFSIGFITILVCWINHHVALEYLKKVDTRFMWINGSLLFIVTLTPFPTAILAGYLENESETALAIFGFNYILISIAADRICSYAYNHHLIEDERREFYYSYKLIYRYGIFYCIIAFFICFVSVGTSIILYAILFTAFAAPKEFASKISRFSAGRRKQMPF
jgi:uncharacterized membrane protein